MPSSRQRRENAHRKLQRQLERRQEQARKRRQSWIITGTAFSVVVIALAVYLIVANTGDDDAATAAGSSDPAAPTEPATPPAATGCTFAPAAGGDGAKDVGVPPDDPEPVAEGTIELNLTTSAGPMTFTLDRATAPCSVQSWEYLVSKKFYDNTTCHRLTTEGLFVLQCGDPSATGSGGPTYQYAEEPPNANGAQTFTYARGMLAMANAGAGTTGGQFFIVYKDSPLPPNYSVVGTVTTGLELVDAIAAKGSTPPSDGKPNDPLKLLTVTEVK